VQSSRLRTWSRLSRRAETIFANTMGMGTVHGCYDDLSEGHGIDLSRL